jgi:hypothetical protein
MIIIIEKATMIISSTLFSLLFRVKETSFLNVRIIFLNVFVIEGFTFHTGVVNIRGAINRITHEREKIEVLGSKTEKRFVIILFCFLSCGVLICLMCSTGIFLWSLKWSF